jgi:hypothetical protein
VTAAMDFFRRPPPGLEFFSDAPLSDGLRQKDRGALDGLRNTQQAQAQVDGAVYSGAYTTPHDA